jgi:hypothetical protein
MSSHGGLPHPGAPWSASVSGNLGIMVQASACGVPAGRDIVPGRAGRTARHRRNHPAGLRGGRPETFGPILRSARVLACEHASGARLPDPLPPAGSPGAAAGVPADRSGELESEVAPVLALLDDTGAECERLITRARREAEQVVAAARSEAGAIAADAAWRAETAREQAARLAMTAAREQAARTTEDAGRQAAQIRELARQRMPALVSRSPGRRSGRASPWPTPALRPWPP